jgi:hypothetical protein
MWIKSWYWNLLEFHLDEFDDSPNHFAK